MGGSSGDTAQVTQTQYNPTNYRTPYVTVHTDSGGTTSSFNKGTWFGDINDYANQNASQMLEEWRNPNLNSATNQAKIQAYNKQVDTNTRNALENNIIAPLSQRNMIRSSQATNMYNGLAKSLADNYDTFITNLLANSSEETGKMIDQLTNWYMQGHNVLNQAEQNAINQASGNAVTYGSSNTQAS